MEKIIGFLREEEGLTMVEYAVAGAMVAAGAVAIFQTLGNNVCDSIETLSDAVTGVVSAPADGC